jgi:hypothetical protein
VRAATFLSAKENGDERHHLSGWIDRRGDGDLEPVRIALMIDLEKARFAPQTYFDTPMDVVENRELSRADKVSVLKAWDEMLHARIRSVGEGMTADSEQTANEASVVEQIAEALRSLDALSPTDDATSTPIVGTTSVPPIKSSKS